MGGAQTKLLGDKRILIDGEYMMPNQALSHVMNLLGEINQDELSKDLMQHKLADAENKEWLDSNKLKKVQATLQKHNINLAINKMNGNKGGDLLSHFSLHSTNLRNGTISLRDALDSAAKSSGVHNDAGVSSSGLIGNMPGAAAAAGGGRKRKKKVSKKRKSSKQLFIIIINPKLKPVHGSSETQFERFHL